MIRRRNFLRRVGLGLPSIAISPAVLGSIPNAAYRFNYTYPTVQKIEDAITTEGFLMVRMAFYSKNPQVVAKFEGQLKVRKGNLKEMKTYFFETGEDSFVPASQFSLHTSLDHSDIIVCWLDKFTADTRIQWRGKPGKLEFTLQDLIDNPEITLETGEGKVVVNLLLDKEIGEVAPANLGITTNGDEFSVAILADTQGGDPTEPTNSTNTRVKIHNAFIEDTIEVVNQLDPQPKFSLILGDIVDHKGQWSNYQSMLGFLKKLKQPVLFAVGNHETEYSAKFEPGYNMDALENYFNAQQEINGSDKLLYSFNLGQWHFVVWPDPLRRNFWETHPHYFYWLEKDLEKHKDKPTVFFHHVPLMPIGINPLESYVESPAVKKMLIDILGRHGNVKYALSGHVHIPLKASEKVAVSYKGIKFINLPAAGYRPRAFGEEDFYGGPTQGVALLAIKGKEAVLQFHNVTYNQYTYPEQLQAFNPEDYPLWLGYKWQLPLSSKLENGDFAQGLAHWHKRFIHHEDENPSNICQVRQGAKPGKPQSLYLLTRKRGYDAPGQDRLPQHLNRICQAVKLIPGHHPVLSLELQIDKVNTLLTGFNGIYIWLEGFQGSYRRVNLVYSAGAIYHDLGGVNSDIRTVPPIHKDITGPTEEWLKLILNPAADFNASGKNFEECKCDRLVVNLGVWCVNDGDKQSAAAYFDSLALVQVPGGQSPASTINGKAILPKDEKYFWYQRVKHVAGEHQYVTML